MATLYGIPNCDTVKKARRWLEQHGVNYTFHDFRQDGLDDSLLGRWLKKVDWQLLLNQRSRTWRELRDSDKQDLTSDTAVNIMLRHPSVIKRPVLAHDGTLLIGFNETEYKNLFR